MSSKGGPGKPNTSGIAVNQQANIDDYNVTGTVTLSRRSMGLKQPSPSPTAPQKTAPPPAAQIAKMPYSVATNKDVSCPKMQR